MTDTNPLPQAYLVRRPKKIDTADIVALATKASAMLDEVRNSMLSPHPRKEAPTFTSNQVQRMCGIDKTRMSYVLNKEDGDLARNFPGLAQGSGRSRIFTLAETIAWMKVERKNRVKRPDDKEGMVLSIVNFKGGSTKSTTSMGLAQGLSLRGHRTLLIDLDPQGSSTALCSILPDAEVREEETVLPAFHPRDSEEYVSSLEGFPIKTYWEGLDLIPACSALFSAEFMTPASVIHDPEFHFWAILQKAIEPLRKDYDVIIIDTSPSLSYLCMNAIMAADGMIMPLPPDGLDFASSISFWNLVAELTNGFATKGSQKTWDFIEVVMSRVDSTNPGSAIIRDWIKQLYGQYASSVEIPKSSVAGASATQFGTLYDLKPSDFSTSTYDRLYDAFDRFIDSIEAKLSIAWDVDPSAGQPVAPIKRVKAEKPTPSPQMPLV